MKRLLLFLVIGAGLASATPARAAGFSTVMPVTTVETIDRGVFVYTGTTSNPSGCAVAGKFYYKSSSEDFNNRFFSLVMTAYTTGNKVRFYSSGCVVIPALSSTATYNTLSSNYTQIRP